MIPNNSARVFVLAGQSNAIGAGDLTVLKTEYSAYAEIFDKCQIIADLRSSPVNYGPLAYPYNWNHLKPGYGGAFGVELSLGRKLAQIYPDDDIYLIKIAAGATWLAPLYIPPPSYHSSTAFHWNPLLIPDTTLIGQLYNNVVITSANVLKDLNNSYPTVTMSGFFWLQGESDAGNEVAAEQYLANLISLINHYRASINTIVPFYIGMMCDDSFWPEHRYTVREAEVSAANYLELPDVFAIETNGFSRYPLKDAQQGHYNTKGLIDFGNTLGDYVEQHQKTGTPGDM